MDGRLRSAPAGRRRAALIIGLVVLSLAGPNLSNSARPVVLAQAPRRPQAAGPVVLHGLTPRPVAQGTATLVGPYNGSQLLRLTLGLQPPNEAAEEQFLHDVQDRQSPLFHRFLSADQWNARFAPAPQSEQAVVNWAQAHGLTVSNRFANRLLVDVVASVNAIEAAFRVRMNSYKLGGTSFFSIDRDPTIPANLDGILHAVLGLNSLEVMHSHIKGGPRAGSADSGPVYAPGPALAAGHSGHGDGDSAVFKAALQRAQSGAATPHVTRGAYDPSDLYSSQAYDWNALYAQGHCCNPLGNPGDSPPQTSIAIATAGDFNSADLAAFANKYGLAYHWNTWWIDGTPTCCDDETTLDTEWSTAMANNFGDYHNTAHVWVYEGANAQLSTFADVYNTILSGSNGSGNLTRNFTTSWGSNEDGYCNGFYCGVIGQPTLDSMHNIFNAMIGQGWSLAAAAGDEGTTDSCAAAGSVDYPASDPDVVAAGGTTAYFAGAFSSETAWNGTGCDNGGSNEGGGGGGCSDHFSVPSYQGMQPCGSLSRGLPDVALNASVGQNFYINGKLGGIGGTSIVAPELAGFFAVENSYLLSLGDICLPGPACAPMGNANPAIYNAALGDHAGLPAHNPFYDVTSGCTGGSGGVLGECADFGYDLATGFGSFNALQLAWAINWYAIIKYAGPPTVSFTGPNTNQWFNFDTTVSWNVADTGTGGPGSGVAGFTPAWDVDPGDSPSRRTPGCNPQPTGLCDSFYRGPEYPNATKGSLDLAAAGQGCHTANVRAWDNTGLGSGDQTFGPVCYDTIPPVTIASLSPAPNASGWNNSPVQVTLSASDPGYPLTGSGVNATYYNFGCTIFCFSNTYTGPFTVSGDGSHVVQFGSKDNSGGYLGDNGNFEATKAITVNIDTTPPHTTASLSGTSQGGSYLAPVQVTLAASDTLSGVSSTQYQIDGGTSQTYGGPFSVSAPGAHTVSFHSTDVAGNAETTQSTSFTIASAATATPTSTSVSVTSTPTQTPVPATSTPTQTPLSATNTPTQTSLPATNTPTATSTATPTHTNTPVPPTQTPVPPTNTPTNTPTQTPVPPTATNTPTQTPVPPTATPTDTPMVSASLVVSPTKAIPFQTITLSGAAFAAGEQVTVSWDSVSATPLLTTTATTGGALAATLTVPQAVAGAHALIAHGLSSGRTASAALTVTPAVFAFPASGPSGASTYLVGVGFGADETVAGLWYPGLNLLSYASSNAVGTVLLPLAIPAHPVGTYYLVGYGVRTKLVAVTPFHLTATAGVSRGATAALPTNATASRGAAAPGQRAATLTWPCAAKTCRGRPLVLHIPLPVVPWTGRPSGLTPAWLRAATRALTP